MSPQCWCGNADLLPFSPQYLRCPVCEALITAQMPAPEFTAVEDDARDFYGREYWFSHQEQDLGFTNITRRVRTDLPERCLHWLRTLLKYKLPPGGALELGCAHGGFVALMRWAGFEATGLELSPWVVDYARETFDIPMLLGPVESQQIEPGSLDVIALMDVLEHLPDPAGTMRHCLNLLKPDGMLVIQTPRYIEGKPFEAMVEQDDRFLEQLKAEQHLYLFSLRSIRTLFERLGVEQLAVEPALFRHYDMFLVASRAPLIVHAPEAIAQGLSATPGGRIILAMLDLDEELRGISDQHAALHERYTHSEADRAARLAVIERQGQELGRIAALEADVAYLKDQLAASEADRAARLEIIHTQQAQIKKLHSRLAEMRALLRPGRVRARLGLVLPSEIKRMHGLIDHALQPPADPPPRGNGTAGESAQAALADGPSAAMGRSRAETRPPDPFELIRDPKTTDPFNYDPETVDRILRDLHARGFVVEDLTLDVAEYQAYFQAAGYTRLYPRYYAFNLPEKSLEHFIAAKLLDLKPDDVYVDIASEHSPVPDIYARLFGCTSYRQDLAYPAGLNGDRIGGDAAAMPVPDGFASKMALHCSFEHFEGDADIRFIREAGRVLRGGGKVVFAPLYLFREYGILTDPAVAVAQQVPFEPDAVVYARPGWQNRHGRLYDPAHLDSRIRTSLGPMQLSIYRVTNATDVDPSCYIQFAAMITKP